MHLFGKMFKILYFKCQKKPSAEVQERKGERKSKSLIPFRKKKKVFICFSF